MKEYNPNIFETKLEHIPNLEEILSVFRDLIKNKYTEVRKREDEKGVYLLDVVVLGDKKNEVIEYSYIRKGQYKEGSCSETEIHVTYYKDDVPVSGTSAARCINGSWKFF